MVELDDVLIDAERLMTVRQTARTRLGLLYDERRVHRLSELIIKQVREGTVGDGLTRASLVVDPTIPSWVSHHELFGQLLTLVALDSYESNGFFLSALVCPAKHSVMPSDEFCAFLESVGVVTSADAREQCLEAWDRHWKMVISHYDVPSASAGG